MLRVIQEEASWNSLIVDKREGNLQERGHFGTHRIILMEIYNESRFKIYVAKGDTARKLRLMGRWVDWVDFKVLGRTSRAPRPCECCRIVVKETQEVLSKGPMEFMHISAQA